MRTTTLHRITWGCLLCAGMLLLGAGRARAYVMADFEKSPAFVTSTVQPFIMLLLDNSSSMNSAAYSGAYASGTNYYGIFESDKYYYHPDNTSGTGTCTYTDNIYECTAPVTTGTCSYPEKQCAYSVWKYQDLRSNKKCTTKDKSTEYYINTCDGSGTVGNCVCTKQSGTKSADCSEPGEAVSVCQNIYKVPAATCLATGGTPNDLPGNCYPDPSVARTACLTTYGGTCTPVVPPPATVLDCSSCVGTCLTSHPILTTTCNNVAEETACAARENVNNPPTNKGICAKDPTARASYWSKTPAAITLPDGTTATTGGIYTDPDGAKGVIGNFLNRLEMNRLDIAKAVLTGGKTGSSIGGRVMLDGAFSGNAYTCVTGGGLYPSNSCDRYSTTSGNCLNGSSCSKAYQCSKTGGIYPSSACGTGCIGLGNTCTAVMDNGDILMQSLEEPRGILQQFKDLSWGYTVFNGQNGGQVKKPIGSLNSDIVSGVNSTVADAYTPMSEALNTVVNYFRQAPKIYDPTKEYTIGGAWDPYYDTTLGSYVTCSKASTILITDGEPYGDETFPVGGANQNAAAGIPGNVLDAPLYSGTGRFYLDDIAYWAHTNDLRNESDGTAKNASMGGIQAMDTYTIFAFGTVAESSKLALQAAAKFGGFTDRDAAKDGKPNAAITGGVCGAGITCEVDSNGKKVPKDLLEWDTDENGVPDNYAEATDGADLGNKMRDMIGKILQKMSAGSAASVISASRSGEGAIYQAIFYPKTPPDNSTDMRTITWAGDIHALWLDDYGNMREDCANSDAGNDCTTSDGILNLKTDKIVKLYTSTTGDTKGQTMAEFYSDPDGNGKADAYLGEIYLRNLSHYVWSGGRWLATASADQKSDYASTAAERYIFTQTDIPGDPIIFTPAALKAGLTLATYKTYLNAADEAEADNIVNYVRGNDISGYRSRLYDWGWGDGARIQKLGDIVGSTPTIVAQPAEEYDTIYLDWSYRRFHERHRDRRIMVYAGANDGGLHAFNGGYYDRKHDRFLKALPEVNYDQDNPTYQKAAYDLGAEMWMFVPKNILPHLKWLTETTYGSGATSHVYYVDLKPYVFDAKIFTPDDIHTDGWGTVLVGGMGFGGGAMTVGATTMRSSFFLLDVTDPENPPVVLAEFTDPFLGYTTGSPTAVPMLRCDLSGGSLSACPSGSDASWPMDWYLALGSGPYDPSLPQYALLGNSTQEALLYLLKLGGTSGSALPYISDGATVLNVPSVVPALAGVGGYPRAVGGSFPKSFFSDMIAVDYDLDFKTDSLYFGSISNTDKAAGANYMGGMHRLITREDLLPSKWTLDTFFNAGKPVSAAPTAAYDGSVPWLFFGTGRLLNSTGDKSDASQQAYFGLKESYTINAFGNLEVSPTNGVNLVDVSKVWVENRTGILRDTTTNAPAVVKSTGPRYKAGGTVYTLAATTFKQLNHEIGEKSGTIDKYNGWTLDFPLSKERNLGQAALLGGTLTFTTYVPSLEACTAEGDSYLWALYYRTGTAYVNSMIGQKTVGGVKENLRVVGLGSGMSTTPSIHSGAETGTKAFVQTSTGAIVSVEQANPGVTTSGVLSWRDRNPD